MNESRRVNQSFLTSLSLSFPICKMGSILLPSQAGSEDPLCCGAMGSRGTCPGSSQVLVVRGQRPALREAEGGWPDKASGLRSLQAASSLLMTNSYLARAQGLWGGRGLHFFRKPVY